jgi:hypothetical protein
MSNLTIAIDPGRLGASLTDLPIEDPCSEPWAHQRRAEAAVLRSLSDVQITTLRHFSGGLHPWLIVRTGFTSPELPETPTGFAPVGDMAWWPLAWMTVGLMSLAGARLVSYASENDGAAFVNLVALPPDEVGARLSERSTKQMRGHTDGVSFPFPSEFEQGGEPHSPAPDLLVLVGLRNPNDTPTRLVAVSEVLAQLTEAEEEALTGPYFNISPQRTFKTEYHRVATPLLSRNEATGQAFRFSHSSVTAVPDAPAAAVSALAHLEQLLPAAYKDVVVKPGDVCLVQNRLVVHGRGSPGQGHGGSSRWLLRTYGWTTRTRGLHSDGMPDHIHV